MKLLLVIIIGLIAISIIASLVGPLIALAIGGTLIYYAFKNLSKRNISVLSIIWWVIVGLIGITIAVHTLPNILFILAIVAVVFFVSRRNSNNQASMNKDARCYEAQWHEITNR